MFPQFFAVAIFLSACSYGGYVPPDPEETVATQPGSSVQLDVLGAAPCVPVRIFGCDLDGSRDEAVLVGCSDGTTMVVGGGEAPNHAVLCADVAGNLRDDLIVASAGRIKVGSYSADLAVDDDTKLGRIADLSSTGDKVIAWGPKLHPTGWAPAAGDPVAIDWTSGPCVAAQGTAACLDARDGRAWYEVAANFGKGRLVSGKIFIVPSTMADMDDDGAMDLVGQIGPYVGWAGSAGSGTWGIADGQAAPVRTDLVVVLASQGAQVASTKGIQAIAPWPRALPAGTVTGTQKVVGESRLILTGTDSKLWRLRPM